MHVMMCFNMDQNVTVQTQEVDLPGVAIALYGHRSSCAGR